MSPAVYVIKKRYKRALSHGKKKNIGKSGRMDEIIAKIKMRDRILYVMGFRLYCMKWHGPLIWVCVEARQPDLSQIGKKV